MYMNKNYKEIEIAQTQNNKSKGTLVQKNG